MKKLLFIFNMLFVAGLFYAQTPTTSQNYIYTRTYLSEDGSKKTESVQYFDGLGRLKQTVSVKATPSGKDLVVPVLYDELGRQPKDFLPLPMATANAGIQTLTEADVNSYYNVANAYVEKIFDNSPLSKVLEVATPGDAWKKNSGHTRKSEFETNITADQVKKFVINSSWANATVSFSVPTVEWYGESQLMKNVTIDEDGNKSITFKDSQGKTILARKMNGTEPVDTYYIYNLYDQLALVITPKANKEITQNGNVVTQSILDQYCYQYKYDNRNRMVEKRLPGKNSWDYFVYDKQNRLVLSQDANQNRKEWTFTKYDKFGRVVYTGLLANTSNRVTMQNSLNAMSSNELNNESRTSTPFAANGQNIYYTKVAFPTSNMTVLTVNYYDDYAPEAPARPNTILGKTTLSSTPTQYSTNGVVTYRSLKGMPTSTYIKNIEDDNWTQSHVWYDSEAKTLGSHSINFLGGYTKTETEIDFAGIIKKTKIYHKRLNTDTEKVIIETFEHDNQNRLLVYKHQVDNNPEEVLSQNTYNDLGQLVVKKVGNTISSPLQTINYTYNIHGKLKTINDPNNLGDDLFGYKINYNEVEGLESPNTDFTELKVKPRFNGDIAEVSWKTLTEDNEPLKRYGYVYDGLSRLSAGFYQKAGNESAKEYFEKIDYDIDGSITRLKRSEGVTAGNSFATMIDNLKYDYAGNRLTKVTDEQQNPSGYPYIVTPNTITYDANGNMTTLLDKGISSIQYNFLNLPKQITQNARVTNYTYRADGVKVKKLFGDIETNYLDGFQYKSTKPSETVPPGDFPPEPDPNEVAEMKLRIIPTAEGYYDALNNQYIYNFTDHLGNVRLSYTDTNKDGVIQPRQYKVVQCSGSGWNQMCIDYWKPGEIVEVNNYYPFGLLHNYTATTQNVYQYKYNGKELQESGMYDFGARMYMPDLGRWGVIDPLAESYRRWSPYHYAMNNPANLTDPDGMGSYDSEGVWHSEMEDFEKYHGLNSYSPFEKEHNTFKTPDGEGAGGGGGITIGDLMDALFPNSNEGYQPDFGKFDFEQFGLEDIDDNIDRGRKKGKGKAKRDIKGNTLNWFNEGDGGLYIAASNDIVPNNTVRVFSHANEDAIMGPDGKLIYNAADFNALLVHRSPAWKKFKEKGGVMILDLRACNTGSIENSFAHRLSMHPDFKNVVIMAPADYYIASGDGKSTHVGGPGNYNLFINGKLVRGKFNNIKR
ncbi:DUF6443 domain-containing protein [Chryseobacterium defluvii]|uniref:RHS repeat-associated protein n=1 Tax=Chryseobacterium defluvii TaxID=160396 RepID=A0A495SNX9_9FLAO|nr:DUF6443 domain-containing protein [Chryseobacterium defluvii]RKT01776.1 RHS repeat-associated protein [Chryseobacterium defluvii]